MSNILIGLLIILAILAVMAVFWYICYRVNIRLECYRKYRETKAKMQAVDETKIVRSLASKTGVANDANNMKK